MEKVEYKTRQSNGVRISTTECTRLRRKGILVGTRECMACSYCYDVDQKKKFVVCRKKRMNFKNNKMTKENENSKRNFKAASLL